MSTMLAEEEQTLLDLSNELEEVTGRMRRAVIDMVHRAKEKIHEAAAKELDLRRKQQELEQQQLIEQLDNMQALNVKHIQKIEAQQDFSDKLLAMLYNVRGRKKEKELLRKCIRAWHSIISRDRWVDVMGDHLTQERNRKLLRRVLSAWRNDAGRSSRDRKLETIGSLHEAEVGRMKADSDLTISALKVELLGCKDTIARGNEERQILEERLKAAVMRGMCALNAEATMVLRGMAGQMQSGGFGAGGMENLPPQQQQQPSAMNAMNQMMMMQQQQQFGGGIPAATAARSPTDQLLSMQSQINNQLNRYQQPAGGNNNNYYVDPNNRSGGNYLNENSYGNNNNNSSSFNNPTTIQQQTAVRPQPQQQRSNNATPTVVQGGNGLVSFNTEHPALQQQRQASVRAGVTTNSNRPSNRTTPSRR